MLSPQKGTPYPLAVHPHFSSNPSLSPKQPLIYILLLKITLHFLQLTHKWIKPYIFFFPACFSLCIIILKFNNVVQINRFFFFRKPFFRKLVFLVWLYVNLPIHLFFLIEIYLTYNIILVLGVQHNDLIFVHIVKLLPY